MECLNSCISVNPYFGETYCELGYINNICSRNVN